MTLDELLPILTLVAALGCGLIAGVFFAFSAFIMKALSRIPPGEGIAAMQSINITVINPWFMLVFFGTAAACAFLAVVAILRWAEEPASIWMLAGSLLYLVGTIVVTLAFNVPRNNALAKLARADTRGATLWPSYLAGWTAWNHVRTIAALAAAASLSLAL